MKRGEIWAVAGAPDYAGRPRPAVIVRDERFADLASVAICGVTTNSTEAPLFRLTVEPTERNRLLASSHLMVDKLQTVPKTKLGRLIGHLDDHHLAELSRMIVAFLGLPRSARTPRP
jgi:mRNA interferase MazF